MYTILVRSVRHRVSVSVAALVATFVLLPGAARASLFACTPTGVAAFPDHIHVRCSTPAPSNVSFVAVCTATDSAFASRALSLFTTAKVTGKQLAIFYDPSDSSGNGCGCSTADCRVLYGAEVQE